jgi:plasmid stabilization system protein ParE
VTPRFIVRPAAEADIAEAALWYEFRSLGLGTDFLRAVDVCFAEIQRSPERFPQVYRQARRALLRRFPYAAYFVSTARGIRVVACMHVKRDPRRWQRRVDR